MLKALFSAKKPNAEALATELRGVEEQLPAARERADAATVEHGRTVQREMSGMATAKDVHAARQAAQDARERADALASARDELERRLTDALAEDADKRAADVRRRSEDLATERRAAMLDLAALGGQAAARLDAAFGPVGAERRHAALLAVVVPDAFRNAETAHELSRVRQGAREGTVAYDALAAFDDARRKYNGKELFTIERAIADDAKTALPGRRRDKALAERRDELLATQDGDGGRAA